MLFLADHSRVIQADLLRGYVLREGHGGEEEAPFLEWEHEYRDVSKQVKFLYLSGEDAPESDRYLLLWFL